MINLLFSRGLTIIPLIQKRSFYLSRKALSLFLFLITVSFCYAAPSHDPTRMIQNNDGRYWIFTTGDGIWCMSSETQDFSTWQAETAPFADGYPSWIDNYVDGFTGSFWAPDIILIDGTYYLYYSCAGDGAAAAIGLTTATDLEGPWTDQGLIVAGDNAIDPAVYYDNGRLWMAWGNWQSGLDILELDPSTGLRLNSTSYHLVDGEVEGPGLIRNGNYYYLFYQRGYCCAGVNSTYYMVVARSTVITGPYEDEMTFLPNQNGNIIGPGHFGYGEDRLTYHYYDGNNDGAATLMITTLGWEDGWPVAGGSGGWESTSAVNSVLDGTYAIIANHSSKALDTYDWGTTDGTNICQWDYWGGECQQFTIESVDGIWHRITPAIATDQAIDVYDMSTEDEANINTWTYWGGEGQQFRFQVAGSGKWRIINRNSEKCLDVEDASTDDGANLIQYTCTSGATHQMFSLESVKSTNVIEKPATGDMLLYPNPSLDGIVNISTTLETDSEVTISVINSIGQEMYREVLSQQNKGEFTYKVNLSDFSSGMYFVNVKVGNTLNQEKIIIK